MNTQTARGISPLHTAWVGILVIGLSAARVAAIVSDDFNACSLNAALWTVSDPVGGGEVRLEGVGTGDAHLIIQVPGGHNHDLWSEATDVIRVMQPAANTDFEIRARFDSSRTQTYQFEGLAVEQDGGVFLRYDVERWEGNTVLFAAVVRPDSAVVRGEKSIGSAASIWLSIGRAGNNWTLRYSADGANWTTQTTFAEVLHVSRVGIFAGNYAMSGPAPAFTSTVDYFVNKAAPFAVEDGTPESPPAILTQQIVGNGTIAIDPDRPAYYCGPTISLTAVPTQGWIFQGWGGDLSGNDLQQSIVMTESRSVTATFAPLHPDVVLSNVGLVPDMTGAHITWTTNAAATGSVAYGTTAAYELGTVQEATLATSHAFALTNLAPGTIYHCKLTSTAPGLTTAESDDLVFTTVANPTDAVSDDFNACTLNTAVWSVSDPVGGADVSLQGAGTPDAQLVIQVPAGHTHDLWVGENNVVRAMQRVANTDFEIQAKFDSLRTLDWQFEGLLIEQRDGRVLRFDVDRGSGMAWLFGATIAPSSASIHSEQFIADASPIWLGIRRSGEQWTLRYSRDGSTWLDQTTFSWAMTVEKVGVFAGNYSFGSAPAFTSKVDYFSNVAAPMTNVDGASVGAVLGRTVVGDGSIVATPDKATYECGESVTLQAVASAGQEFQGWSGDITGTDNPIAVQMNNNLSVTATFISALIPPTIAPLADDTAFEGISYSRTPVLVQGAAPVTWSLLQGPADMTISPTAGTVEWPTPGPVGASVPVSVQASNAAGTAEANWTIAVATVPPDGVLLLDRNLSATTARDGQVVTAGYRLGGAAGMHVTLGCNLSWNDHAMTDRDRETSVQLGQQAAWYSRDFLVNLGPNFHYGPFDVTWAPRWGDGMMASHEHQYLTIQPPVPIRVPILMYHYFGPEAISPYFVTTDEFRGQMQALKAYGYTPMFLQELMDCRAGVSPLPAKPILITIDDGVANQFTEALPILTDPAIDYKATSFIVTDQVGVKDPVYPGLTWEQIQTMQASGHVDCQSHSVTHPYLASLTGDALMHELADSKAALEAHLSKPVKYLSWPYGNTNAEVNQAAWQAGYFAAVSAFGGVDLNCHDKWNLQRVWISSDLSVNYDAHRPEAFFMTAIGDPDTIVPQIQVNSIAFLDPLTDEALPNNRARLGESVKIRLAACNAGLPTTVTASLVLDDNAAPEDGLRFDSHASDPTQDASQTLGSEPTAFEWVWSVPADVPTGQYYAKVEFHDVPYVLKWNELTWVLAFEVVE